MTTAVQKAESSVVSFRREQVEPMSIPDMMTMAEMFVRSGMFGDVRDIAKAFVKIQAGREIGVPPFAAMRGVSIIQGQAALGATLIAGRMKAHGYDWEEVRRDNQACELRIIKPNGKLAGISGFSMEDAKAAGLNGKDNWKKYPKAMLFARCITDAARTWAPEVFAGIPVYTQEELGHAATVDTAIISEPLHKPEPETTPSRKPVRKASAVTREEITNRVTNLRTECVAVMGYTPGLEAFVALLQQHGAATFAEMLKRSDGLEAAQRFAAELDERLETFRTAAPAEESKDDPEKDWLPEDFGEPEYSGADV